MVNSISKKILLFLVLTVCWLILTPAKIQAIFQCTADSSTSTIKEIGFCSNGIPIYNICDFPCGTINNSCATDVTCSSVFNCTSACPQTTAGQDPICPQCPPSTNPSCGSNTARCHYETGPSDLGGNCYTDFNLCSTPTPTPVCSCLPADQVPCNTMIDSYSSCAVCTGKGTQCPTNQVCTSTGCLSPPTVDLKVNGAPSVTVNSGDGVVLSWTTTNTDPTRRCRGTDSFADATPFPNDSPYPAIIQTNTDSIYDLTKTYTLTCYNSAGTASVPSSVSVIVSPQSTPVCIPSCPNSSDITCGAALGMSNCGTTCSGTGTKCTTAGQICQGTPLSCVTPTDFSCTIWAQQPINPCTSSPCPVNLGANYAGPRNTPIQQCWSKNGVQWGCNTNTDNTSHNFACGQTTSVSLTATEAGSSQIICTTNITPTCSSVSSISLTTSTSNLVCLRGAGNCSDTGNANWSLGWTSTATGGQCNYPTGTTPNDTSQRHAGGVCWTPTSDGPTKIASSVGVQGRFLLRNADGSETYPPVTGTNSIYPIWWWIYHTNTLGHCILQGTINGRLTCLQEKLVDATIDGRHYAGNGDAPVPSTGTNFNQDTLQLYQWPSQYEPIGYYTYQSVTSHIDHQYTCLDTQPCGRSQGDGSWGYLCSANCTSCRNADCRDEVTTVEDGCKLLSDQTGTPTDKYSVKSSLQSLSNFVQNQINTVTPYCHPSSADEARIDIVFKRAIYRIYGTVFYDDNGNGVKDPGEGRIYDSNGTVVLNLSGTANSQPVNLSSATSTTGYSFDNLRTGNYTLTLTLPPGSRLRITSANLVAAPLQNLSSDQRVDFEITSIHVPWLYIEGDVHSNTRISLPPGPSVL